MEWMWRRLKVGRRVWQGGSEEPKGRIKSSSKSSRKCVHVRVGSGVEWTGTVSECGWTVLAAVADNFSGGVSVGGQF